MKIIVIGSGLLGLTSAYFLRQHKHDITVIDRQSGPGLETSFANGSLLTPSMSDPWNAPGSWRVLLASLFRPNSPLKLRAHQIPNLTPWGLSFLANSSRDTFHRNTQKNLQLALYSADVLRKLRADSGISYQEGLNGTLKVFRDLQSFDVARAIAEQLTQHGLVFESLSSRDTIAIEPALDAIKDKIVGSIRYPADEMGNAHLFCCKLREILEADDVEFKYSTAVTSFRIDSNRIKAIVAGGRDIGGDQFILAAGSYSTNLLRSIGVQLPVRPAKGYSITFDRVPAGFKLRIPVIDDALHAVVVQLGAAIRVAGTAEFAGYDLSIDEGRVRNLVELINGILPQLGVTEHDGKPWCGLRPMCVDGVPIIGPAGLENLFLNTGHGHLGWTMAAGSGKLLADLMSSRAPEIDLVPYSLSRFTS